MEETQEQKIVRYEEILNHLREYPMDPDDVAFICGEVLEGKTLKELEDKGY